MTSEGIGAQAATDGRRHVLAGLRVFAGGMTFQASLALAWLCLPDEWSWIMVMVAKSAAASAFVAAFAAVRSWALSSRTERRWMPPAVLWVSTVCLAFAVRVVPDRCVLSSYGDGLRPFRLTVIPAAMLAVAVVPRWNTVSVSATASACAAFWWYVGYHSVHTRPEAGVLLLSAPLMGALFAALCLPQAVPYPSRWACIRTYLGAFCATVLGVVIISLNPLCWDTWGFSLFPSYAIEGAFIVAAQIPAIWVIGRSRRTRGARGYPAVPWVRS